MHLSARNQIKGKVASVQRGPIMAIVQIDIGGGNALTSVITCSSSEQLGLEVGDDVTAVFKSSDVIVAKLD